MLPEESHALLSASESGETSNDEKPENTARTMRRTSILRKFLYCSLCICLGFIGGLYIGERLSPYTRHSLESPLPTCNSPSTRLEWRSLHDTEKHDYIQAVQCLRSIPSILSLPQSLYDDFPYVHMHVGNITHDTAGFLPWHRYFVHIYETALRNRCNYTGAMVYWDWTQDWANFRESPVWDSETGFGGDGGVDAPRSVGEGRCVTDGPFAGLNALYSNLRYRPHCFSRGFPSERELARWTQAFRPEAVKQVMAIQEYESFYLQLENGPHLAIPYSIRGDFYRFTAPYDPLFFLHHTQLDRLWWEWQRDAGSSKIQWGGIAWDGTNSQARIHDMLNMSQLAISIPAADVMSTTTDLLCYQY